MTLPHSFIIEKNQLLTERKYRDHKDPCPIFDGKKWHLFGSAGSSLVEQWNIFHATSDSLQGQWNIEEPALLTGLNGDHVAAPGIVYDEGRFHMFVQTEFTQPHGKIIYLASDDGNRFNYAKVALHSIPNTNEEGIYDPHPSIIHGKKHITYCAFPKYYRPDGSFAVTGDIYVAESSNNRWDGEWINRTRVLSHEEVPHHNQRNHPDYEWGLEGPQLIELPDGKVLLNAVCFLPNGKRGTRQRVFFAVGDAITGPYKTLGPIFTPENSPEEKEDGHAAGFIEEKQLKIAYQERYVGTEDEGWRYNIASIDLEKLSEVYSSGSFVSQHLHASQSDLA